MTDQKLTAAQVRALRTLSDDWEPVADRRAVSLRALISRKGEPLVEWRHRLGHFIEFRVTATGRTALAEAAAEHVR